VIKNSNCGVDCMNLIIIEPRPRAWGWSVMELLGVDDTLGEVKGKWLGEGLLGDSFVEGVVVGDV
jgi:hypothetical protein